MADVTVPSIGDVAGNAAPGVTVNQPTVGRIPIDASVECAVVVGLAQSVETLELMQDRADFAIVLRELEAANAAFGGVIANHDRRLLNSS